MAQWLSPQRRESSGDLEPATPRPLGGRARGGSPGSAGALEAALEHGLHTSRCAMFRAVLNTATVCQRESLITASHLEHSTKWEKPVSMGEGDVSRLSEARSGSLPCDDAIAAETNVNSAVRRSTQYTEYTCQRWCMTRQRS